MKLRVHITVIFIGIAIISCVSSSNDENPAESGDPSASGNPYTASELIPLKLNNKWFYAVNTPLGPQSHTYEVTGETSDANFTPPLRLFIITPFGMSSDCFSAHTLFRRSCQSLYVSGFFNNADGNHMATIHSGVGNTSLWFKYPVTQGESFGNTTVGTLSLPVNSGYFPAPVDCIQYIYNDGFTTDEYYIAPGIGIVKAILNNGTIIYNLTGYIIN